MVALGTTYSKIMYIKINTSVNLSSGLSIPAGSVVTIAEGYADIKSEKEGVIPAQVATFVFASEAAYQQGLEPVSGVSDFNPVFGGLELSVSDYQTKTAEALLVTAVEGALVAIYGAENISVVNG
jgi:hypothetical protein